MIGHPFQDLPGWAVWALGVLTLIALLGGIRMMSGPNRDMKATGGPGIIPLELAGTDGAVRKILAAWGKVGQAAALRSLTGDGVFIVGYAGLLAVLVGSAAATIGRATWQWMEVATAAIAWLAIVAGVFDVVEDLLIANILTRALRGHIWPRFLPRSVYCSAAAKFSLIALVVSWLLLICIPILVITTVQTVVAG